MTSAPNQFLRTADVLIYPGVVNDSTPSFFQKQGQEVLALDVSKLRIQFHIEKSIDKEVNTCKITITNLNLDSRMAIEKTKPLIVDLTAGYDNGQPLLHLFSGDVRFAFSEQKGAEWETEIHLGDGDRAYKYARVSKSFGTGTTYATAIKHAASTMGLSVPSDILSSPALQVQFASGHAMSGPTQLEMDTLLNKLGYSWSIQGGKLKIHSDDQVKDNEAYVIDEAHGMIGSPAWEVPDKSKKPRKLKVKNLLRPELEAGGWVEITSRDIAKKQFRIHKIVHKGDTHSRDTWYTEFEAREV